MIFEPTLLEQHSDYDPQGLDIIYSEEKKHFWFIARRERIHKLFAKFIHKNSKIIEVGAGTGSVTRYLIEKGYDVSSGEIHISGLKYAKSYGVKNCYQFDIYKQPFEKEFDAVGMFDVLEHLENDQLALKKIHEMLNPKGHLLLSVPAGMWLWSREDKVAGHKRRYSKKDLVTLLEATGYEVKYISYMFSAILPLLILRRFIRPDSDNRVEFFEYSISTKMPKSLNFFLLWLTRIESTLGRLQSYIYGGSILVVAKKAD